MKTTATDKELGRLRLQQRRLVSIRDAVKYLQKGSGIEHQAALCKELRNNAAKFIKDCNIKNAKEKEAKDYMEDDGNTYLHNYITLTKLASDYEKRCSKLDEDIIHRVRQDSKNELNKKTSHRKISSIIKGPKAQPLRVFQRPGSGTYTTDEAEIDEIARKAWDSVYDGNTDEIDKVVANFMKKYDKYIFKAKEFKVEKLKWEDVKTACTSNIETAGGLDAWTKRDLAWISDKGFQWLTRWFTKIEKTKKWPEAQTKARAVFLCKDPKDAGNPMAYRILKITSSLYRIWASVRMKDMEAWVLTWADKCMFAGIPGAGAEEGWYLTQLDFELKRLAGIQITAGSIDIFKCFDQILRPLIIELAKAAGMPSDILDTYEQFVENMSIMMQVGNSLGVEHKHKCSIP